MCWSNVWQFQWNAITCKAFSFKMLISHIFDRLQQLDESILVFVVLLVDFGIASLITIDYFDFPFLLMRACLLELTETVWTMLIFRWSSTKYCWPATLGSTMVDDVLFDWPTTTFFGASSAFVELIIKVYNGPFGRTSIISFANFNCSHKDEWFSCPKYMSTFLCLLLITFACYWDWLRSALWLLIWKCVLFHYLECDYYPCAPFLLRRSSRFRQHGWGSNQKQRSRSWKKWLELSFRLVDTRKIVVHDVWSIKDFYQLCF